MRIADMSYQSKNDQTEFRLHTRQMMFMYGFLIVFYLIFIIAFSTADHIKGNASGFAFPFILIHALIMFGIPYLMMRRSVSRMKYDLERDLFFMTKK
jgi:cytochrome c biogenesis protein CcdA